MRVIIEAKDPKNTFNYRKKLFELIHTNHVYRQVEIFSFDKGFVASFKREHPTITTGLFSLNPYGIQYEDTFDKVGIHYLNVLLNPSVVDKLKAKNKSVYVWTVDWNLVYNLISTYNVDAVITNEPLKLKATHIQQP